MLKKILALSCIAMGSPFAAKPLPYGLSPWVDGPMAMGLYAMKSNSDAQLARTRADNPWNPSLNRSSIPSFDRWAIGNYSTH